MRRCLGFPLAAFGLALVCTLPLPAQVFVVGMKTATADVVTEFQSTHVPLPDKPLDEAGRLDLVRNLEAEQGFAHRELPLGAGLTLLANGNMTPGTEEYRRMVYVKGISSGPGERVQVTRLEFKADRILVDLNGGPFARHRFLSHISVNNMQLAQQGPTATGCRITLVFEGGVPEVTAAEVKALLEPLVDFKARTSAEAYADTLPPRVREAIEEHEVLVGMDRRMVLAALGEPRAKHREHVAAADVDSAVYEEWIYGEPPRETRFVRFQQGRVVRLEVAALGKPLEIHDRVETGQSGGPGLLQRAATEHTIVNGDRQRTAESLAGPAPTLRRPGEPVDAVAAGGMGKVVVPGDVPSEAKPLTAQPTMAETSSRQP